MKEKRIMLSEAARIRRRRKKLLKEDILSRLFSRLRKRRKKLKKRGSAPS